MKAAKNWKDEIISYFNTKIAQEFSFSKGKIWPSVLAHKSIQHFKHACSFLGYWKCIPQPWENTAIWSLTNTLIPPQQFKKNLRSESSILLLKQLSKPNWKQLAFLTSKTEGVLSEIWAQREIFMLLTCLRNCEAKSRNISTLGELSYMFECQSGYWILCSAEVPF